MSSSLPTAPCSRSSSPHTPESSDSLDPVAIHNDLDLSWFHSRSTLSPSWEMDPTLHVDTTKPEEDHILHLDDLIEQHAYDDSSSPAFNATLVYPPSKPTGIHDAQPVVSSVMPSFRPANLLVPSQHGPVCLTKPIPPPASRPRKRDPSTANQKVVHPPKESCYNLPIMVPSIPEGGTKSRVETQVRVTVDLADASGSSDPYRYDRVGSWKWLKLPPGTATKKRTRKQGKIDPEPQDILHLSASVTCASPPHNRVLSCSSCQAREAKRVAKKLAARVRPARSDSDSFEDPAKLPTKPKQQEDTTSIIQFNCAEVLDFSTGSVVLPLRITCYCRHHREKLGFNVHFTMMDHTGRIVGTGTSRPIMITDDHKTSTTGGAILSGTSGRHGGEFANGFSGMEFEWSRVGGVISEVSASEVRAPSKRIKDPPASMLGKKRAKPYDATSKRNRVSRETSISSLSSPSTSYPTLPDTRSPTPSSLQAQFLTSQPPPVDLPQLHHSSHESESSSDTLVTPHDQSPDIFMPPATPKPDQRVSSPSTPLPISAPPAVLSPLPHQHLHHIPFMFFDSTHSPNSLSLPLPTIHRLIPSSGPTHGGVEVTILGANFHPSIQLNCVFGDVVASSTQRWSDNTLVCVLPPRATAGVVAVWFDGFPKAEDQGSTPPSLFTYSDESDRALMELALQVVGLKMTGKIEDAKNVAMRIVGNAGDGSESQNGGNTNDMMQVASTLPREIRPLLFFHASDSEDFESLIVDFLTILDTPIEISNSTSIPTPAAISHQTPSGQTLLHLAAFLGFEVLVGFLVRYGADLDVRDRNGYTPLHFAAISGAKGCVQTLINAGADGEIVNALGQTPVEIAGVELFEGMAIHVKTNENDSDQDSLEERSYEEEEDEEVRWGDAEEEAEDDARLTFIKRTATRHTPRWAENSIPSEKISQRDPQIHPASPPSDNSDQKLGPGGAVDEKQTASFVDMIQRTLAQLPAPQGIIPNIPQLPLPHLPQFPELAMPTVPWGALPQIPMVFPVFVPMPGWPSFFGGEQQEPNKGVGEEENRGMGAGAIRAAQEWRTTWEKWMAVAIATATARQTEEMPPPMYTPRVAEGELSPTPQLVQERVDDDTTCEDVPQEQPFSTTPSRSHSTSDIRPTARRFDYGLVPITDQEVNAYGYRPATNQTQKLQKKHDRMLLLFWLPILLFALLWAFHRGVQFTFQALKTALPLKTGIRT